MDKYSYLSNADVSVIEELYEKYRKDADSVDSGWKEFFQGFEFAREQYGEEVAGTEQFYKEFKVINLINAYRSRGHLFTKTNPVRQRRQYSPTLDLENFGLDQHDLEQEFAAGSQIGIGKAKLKDIVQHLQETYCRSIGTEYMYIRNVEINEWLRDKMESTRNMPDFTVEEKKHILHKLNQAVIFENFLHKKFVGQKRFSLEGGESLIPALNAVVERGSQLGIEEFVMGMAHRGRLNVLANIFNKTYESIFSEFEGKEYEDNIFDGDVKYHLGYSCNVVADSGKKVQMTLAPNPSHLEAVDPVVEGIVRSKIDTYLNDSGKIAPVLIHGDASIAGQGVVYELVQMAHLRGYQTGGTIHIVINNQLGFTTNYLDGRSSTYCTDVGKVTLCPVFHVNGDDVEAVVHTVQMAMEYRQQFKRDVFIDLLCYRKYGHNEGDEPRFTQPLLYKAIAKHPNPREIYLEELLKAGVVKKEEVKELENEFNQMLQERLEEARQIEKATITHFLEDTWKGFRPGTENDFKASPDTGFNKKRLIEIGEKITSLPPDKKFFKKLQKLMEERKKMVLETGKLDWAMGELLAYATLLDEKFDVRMSGQDCERGTFSHRHAVIKVDESEEEFIPLKNVSDKQGYFHIYNSLLSEYAVVGFDYGYALATPNCLTIWEAQFGDFANGAQIIFDQFLSSGEEKWRATNGLVLFLPHGYEGQGAEHSSSRLERFLILCAEENMQVVNCTTPANFFHVLRRQMHRPFRKPLIVCTPKSLLRHPECISSIDELAKGKFREVIDDDKAAPEEVKKVVFCNGKLYYELAKRREELNANSVALIRIEQLYPLPLHQLRNVISRYKKAKKYVWAQEEPENMGAWSYLLRNFRELRLDLVARPASGSPASGSHKRHEQRQKAIIDGVFQDVETINLKEKKRKAAAG